MVFLLFIFNFSLFILALSFIFLFILVLSSIFSRTLSFYPPIILYLFSYPFLSLVSIYLSMYTLYIDLFLYLSIYLLCLNFSSFFTFSHSLFSRFLSISPSIHLPISVTIYLFISCVLISQWEIDISKSYNYVILTPSIDTTQKCII